MAKSVVNSVAGLCTGMGDNVLTVGAGGQFSSLDDALYEAGQMGEYTTLASGTGVASASEDPSAEDKRIVSTSSALSDLDNKSGDLFMIVDGSVPFKCHNLGGRNGYMAERQLPSNYSNVDISIVKPIRKHIVLLPGLDWKSDTTLTNAVPSFVSIGGVAGAPSNNVNVATSATILFDLNSATEVFFHDLNAESNFSGGGFVFEFSTSSVLSSFYFNRLSSSNRSSDILFGGTNVMHGSIYVENCHFSAAYDAIRLSQCQEAVIKNCIIDAVTYDATIQVDARCIVLGASVDAAAIELKQRYVIKHNVLKAFGQDRPTKSHGDVYCVQLANSLSDDAVLDISNNFMYARGDSAAKEVVCVSTDNHAITPTEQPEINVINNTLDAVNYGAGNAYAIDGGHASLDINRAHNRAINGAANGSTTDISASLI